MQLWTCRPANCQCSGDQVHQDPLLSALFSYWSMAINLLKGNWAKLSIFFVLLQPLLCRDSKPHHQCELLDGHIHSQIHLLQHSFYSRNTCNLLFQAQKENTKWTQTDLRWEINTSTLHKLHLSLYKLNLITILPDKGHWEQSQKSDLIVNSKTPSSCIRLMNREGFYKMVLGLLWFFLVAFAINKLFKLLSTSSLLLRSSIL